MGSEHVTRTAPHARGGGLRSRAGTPSNRICGLMPGYATAFGRGLILGAGAALLYAAARESIAPARPRSTEPRQANDRDRLIDWELATTVAIRAAGRAPSLHPGARAQLHTQYTT